MDNLIDDEQYDEHQQPPPQPEYSQTFYTPSTPIIQQQTPFSIFDNLDKNAYILIFATFILGFFMGKTMQPVIIRQ